METVIDSKVCQVTGGYGCGQVIVSQLLEMVKPHIIRLCREE